MERYCVLPYNLSDDITSPVVKMQQDTVAYNFFHPERIPYEYDQYLDNHIHMVYMGWIDHKTSIGKWERKSCVKKEEYMLAFHKDLYMRYYNSHCRGYCLFLAEQIARHEIRLGHPEAYFEWKERMRTLPGYNLLKTSELDIILKYFHGQHIDGVEFISSYGLDVTTWGKGYREEICTEVNRLFDRYENPGIMSEFLGDGISQYDYIYEWDDGLRKELGIPKEERGSKIYLYTQQKYIDFCKSLIREAENNVREKLGICKVGQGWVCETELYNKICRHYPNLSITQHYMADWLGLQHIDIFIDDENIAIEYQGEQHAQNVEIWGGEQGLQKRIEQDKKKVDKCLKHKTNLLLVYPKYNTEELFTLIDTLLPGNSEAKVYHIGKYKK